MRRYGGWGIITSFEWALNVWKTAERSMQAWGEGGGNQQADHLGFHKQTNSWQYTYTPAEFLIMYL